MAGGFKVRKGERRRSGLIVVGSKDDSILYPQSGPCDRLVWWEKPQGPSVEKCGMG